ncbi:MAG: hypothetical protein N2036_02225 [Bryobacteraceae bacterium]|nr:hypothetical protein [Bryobacteraceae bacterium]MCX7602869.1 hypothetical protein [Bryobacteraceae bacterium]
MTGLGALLDWFAASKELAAAEGRRDLQDARLRALPREEIFLYVKPIDNTRVRCVEARSEWLSSAVATLCVLLIAGSFMLALAPSSIIWLCNHRIEELKQERAALLNEYRALRAEEAALLSPEKLEQYAGERFVNPSPKDMVYAPPPKADVAKLGRR